MYTSFTLLYALAALVSVHGSPAPVNKRAPSPKILYANDFAAPTSAPVIEKRDNECQIVDVVVSALKVVSQVAYPFCSTYISIPNVTSTVTFTTTVTPAAVGVTATITPAAVVVTASATATSTIASSTTTIYSHYTPAGTKEKRAAPTIPPYLSNFGASQVSKACSCLSIPAKTTTVTTTVGATLAPQTISANITAPAPTSTSTSTTTVTVAASSTTIPAICAPSAINVQSGVLSSEGNASPQEVISPATTVIDCCVACFNAANCLSYLFNPSCSLFILNAAPAGDQAPPSAAQAALCPVGVSTQDTLFPAGISTGPISNGFRPGPCVVEAPALL
ncbi:hypothetical protein MMC28_006170 [Mycoblastus sanguinarius]|nr:hypothetical protein [Mycoblastus sanguinarius]